MCYSFISKVKESFHTASGPCSYFEVLFWFLLCHFPFWNEIVIFQPVKICQSKFFLLILNQSSMPSNTTPLYFFSSNVIYFNQKESIKVHISETFERSGENLPNSSCHFPNHKSIFLQIFYCSSVSLNITLLYFFIQTLYTLVNRMSLKWKILRPFECSGQNSTIPRINFETTYQFLFKVCIILHCHET